MFQLWRARLHQHLLSENEKRTIVGQNAQEKGKVFALSGVKVSISDNLIQATYFLDGIPLNDIIDTSVTHLFISYDCFLKLNMEMSLMKGNMVIDTPANGYVATSLFV